MKAVIALLVLSLFASTGKRPIREGYATTYSYHDKAAPALVFIATTRRGLTLSIANDPIALKKWAAELYQVPKPFYIQVFPDHIVATDPQTGKTSIVALRDVVEIVWQK